MDSWTKCNHCGYIHDGVCPKIKSIEYFENGMIKKVEKTYRMLPCLSNFTNGVFVVD